MVSRLSAADLMPARLKVPKLGLNPTMPQKDDGRSTEPPVWVPSATGTMKSATPAAEPWDDPPGVRAASCGLVVAPGWVPANSAVTVLPRITAPAARRIATVAASAAGRCPW